ncbi:MAG: ribonuclease HII [Bacteroidales bacterium]|nr:ribonuclease HII [Bacteroidales bacterium]
MLLSQYTPDLIECGCDEAGRGCLAGAVFAAAVILPKDFHHELLNDSKQLTERQRYELREMIYQESVCWAVASVDAAEIDQTNILRASMHAMNLAVAKLTTEPELLLIDGNRFYPENIIPYHTIVKGDGKYMSIAAASILAKTWRDDYMKQMHETYPQYGFDRHKGYPTAAHYAAIEEYGPTPIHRMTFKLSRNADSPLSKSKKRQK